MLCLLSGTYVQSICCLVSGCIYQRRKEELVAIAQEFGLDKEGCVEELRRRLSTSVQEGSHSSEIWARLAELESQFAKTLELLSWGVPSDVAGRPCQKSEPDHRSSQLYRRPRPPIPGVAVTGVEEAPDPKEN
nr:uncharacterized protein LOC116650439 [Drosophila virilis]